VIAVDTNVLVHAHRFDSPWNERAFPRLQRLIESRAAWAIPWPCVHEFLSVVTNRRIWPDPTPIGAALDQVDAWQQSPGGLVLLNEAGGYWEELRRLAENARLSGAKFHDARIAAICISHGVRELWTADRDFGHFPALTTRNPLASDD
jgi:hypothetical protein